MIFVKKYLASPGGIDFFDFLFLFRYINRIVVLILFKNKPMDSPQQPSSPVPVKKILVKRVKVLVKRPVSAPSQSAPIIKQPVAPAPVKPAGTFAAPAPVPPSRNESPAKNQSGSNGFLPFAIEIPKDITATLRKADNIFVKMFLFYVYARIYAKKVAQQNGYQFPKMRIPLPESSNSPAEFLQKFKKKKPVALIQDLREIAPFINGLERIMKSTAPTEKLLEAERLRIGDQVPSTSDQIILAYLDIRLDMQIISQKIELRGVKEQAKEIIKNVKKIKEDVEAVKKRFVAAIERKKFPVDAKKLIDNYFNLSKKEPEKAYQTLITNPLFFSPILLEKMPKNTSAAKASAINKQLASFLKGLKI